MDLIYSWTPRQFRNLIKGSQLRTIDSFELAAASALFTGKVKGAKKRIKLSDIYDADKARKEIDNPVKKSEPLNLERYQKARQAMKNYSPSMS